jgi:hypothetical protein
VSWKPDYIDRAALKSYLQITENSADAFIDAWITTVSRNVDDFCGRQFGKVATAVERFYTPEYDRHECEWLVDIDDLQDTTGLVVTDEDGEAVAAADYVLLPRNAPADGVPYEQLRLASKTGELTIEGLWGWNDQPAAVSTGMYLQGARLAVRRDSPFGVAGSPSEGSELRLLAQLDPDFRTSLRPLQRDWWAA